MNEVSYKHRQWAETRHQTPETFRMKLSAGRENLKMGSGAIPQNISIA